MSKRMEADRLGPYLLGPNDENQGIYTGDARELAAAIPDESVDLIFTDPVYDRIDDYRWLAETAARVLKPDRACLVWTSTALMSKVIRAMEPPLEWAWLMSWRRYGPCYPGRSGICVSTICLWLEKGHSRTYRKIADCKDAPQDVNNRNNKHRWSKPEPILYSWLEAFTKPGQVVLDLFCGGGSIPAVCKILEYRRWLAFEIDPDTAEAARQRVRQTQPPLFVPEPQQAEMAL